MSLAYPKPLSRKVPEFIAWLHDEPCCVSGCYVVVVHHPRGRRFGDEHNGVPLLDGLHKEGHNQGWKTFERKYRVNLRLLAVGYWVRWLDTQSGVLSLSELIQGRTGAESA